MVGAVMFVTFDVPEIVHGRTKKRRSCCRHRGVAGGTAGAVYGAQCRPIEEQGAGKQPSCSRSELNSSLAEIPILYHAEAGQLGEFLIAKSSLNSERGRSPDHGSLANKDGVGAVWRGVVNNYMFGCNSVEMIHFRNILRQD